MLLVAHPVRGFVPRVGRRGVRLRLRLACSMFDEVVKRTARQRSHAEFGDRVAHAVARVATAVRVARVGRRRHQHTDEAHGTRRRVHRQRHRATLPVTHVARWERHPFAVRGVVDSVAAGPVLHLVRARVRIAPRQLHRVDAVLSAEVDDRPLRVLRVRVARKRGVEVRVALPVRRGIAVVEAAVVVVVALIARVAAMREAIPVRIADRHRTAGARAGPVALVAARAPRAHRVPVPVLDAQFGIQAIRDRADARRRHLLHVLRGVDLLHRAVVLRVDTGADRAQRAKPVERVRGRRVDGHRVRLG